MYTHKSFRPHHSWFILLSDNFNNNIIWRLMLLVHRLSSYKFYSCTRYLDMYMYSACSSKQLSKKCVCNSYLCIWVCVYLWHIWLVYIHVWASFIPASFTMVHLINIYFFICVISQAFWPLLKVKIVLYFTHVNEVRNGYYNPIKEYIFNRPPDRKIRLLSTLYCSYFVKDLNPGVIS